MRLSMHGGNDQCIHDTTRHHALQILPRILVVRARQHDEIELVARKHALQTAGQAKEEVVGVFDRFLAGPRSSGR